MLRKDIVISFGGQVLRSVLATVGGVALARGLGPGERGLYALAVWMPTTLCFVAQYGQAEVNATFAGLHRERRPQLFIQTLAGTLLLGGLGMLAILAYFYWLPVPRGKFEQVPLELVPLAALLLPVFTLDNNLRELLRGSDRVAAVVSIGSLGYALRALAILLLVFALPGGLTAALWITLLVPLLTSLLYVWKLRDQVFAIAGGFSRRFLGECLRFGSVMVLSPHGNLVLQSVGTLVLGYLEVSRDAIGQYAVALMFGQQMGLLPTSIAQAFLPRLSNDPGKRLAQTPRVFRLTLLICLGSMVVLALVGCPALLSLVGWDYLGSIPPVLIMLPGLTFYGPARILGVYLRVIKKPRYGMLANWGGLSVTLALCLLLIPRWGIAGAALANTLGLTALSALTVWAYLREAGEGWRVLVPGRHDVGDLAGEIAQAALRVKQWMG